jgi:hypothetical protein
MEELPDEDISIVNKLVRKLVLAWDPTFSKVTSKEKGILDKADAEMSNGDYISEEDFWSLNH